MFIVPSAVSVFIAPLGRDISLLKELDRFKPGCIYKHQAPNGANAT
jgi:hypothetical protein